MATPALALLLALAAASATMLGWVVSVVRPSWQPRSSGWMLLIAAAAMLAVSMIELLPGAVRAGLGIPVVTVWAVIGCALVLVLRAAARRLEFGGTGLQQSAMIIAVAIAIHNIPEGAAPYASALISVQSGLITALGLGLHNIAEGMAVAIPVMAGGGARRRAFWLVLVATAGEMAGALLAFSMTAGGLSKSTAGGLIAFVAGVMITVSLLELLPSAIPLIRMGASRSEPGPAPQPAGVPVPE